MKPLSLGFTVILLMFPKFVILLLLLRLFEKFIYLLILVSSQLKMYIIVNNLVNVNHLIYHVTSNFINIFHYFCKYKAPKIKRLHQYIKSHHFTAVFIKRLQELFRIWYSSFTQVDYSRLMVQSGGGLWDGR